ncbi:MAG: HDOD domain-containing protein [Acidobacteriia bacterium]|nr:HDOD domain-containing protein [Terriglobia bacterium]
MGADPIFLSDDPSAQRFDAHCRRVAAWTVELARARQLNTDEIKSLERAALLHHNLLAVLQGDAREHFLSDLGVHEVETEPAPGGRHEILEIANALDEHFEWEPFSDHSENDVNPAAAAALDCLRCAGEADLQSALRRLPVFPVAAQKALALLTRDDWNAYDLRVVASADQVLASEMIRAANSWAFAPLQPIMTLPHAITYIGADHASKILLAASLKPLFASPKLGEIWNHALEASEAAQCIAKLSGRVHPEQAFLAGLVHDIGRLAMALLPPEFQRRSARLLEKGCELMLVERALCGSSHAELGAAALRQWGFPDTLIDAVRFHHEPDLSDSALASVLYLAERCTNPWEDLPSIVRRTAAMNRLGLQHEALSSVDRSSKLDGLRYSR